MKNRRDRNSKLSEYKLRRLVECFARDMTVKEAAEATRVTETTVRNKFLVIRQRIFDHGFLRISKRESDIMPARYVFARKHRGVPEKYAELYESEFLHRAFFTKRPAGFQRFKANNPDHMKRVKKLAAYNTLTPKYDIIEQRMGLDRKPKDTRPFDIGDYALSSDILINEKNLDPIDAYFRFVWKLLLAHPL